MRISPTAVLIALALPLSMLSTASFAQSTSPAKPGVTACPTQSDLEQSINSDGSITPDDCTTLQVNSLTADSGAELCLIDFDVEKGIIGQIRDAAFPTQWWVKCDDLVLALQGTP